MKSVLISIQPKGVEKIANREKTIEVRKSRPKIDMPFKCYIYCTKYGKLFFHGGIGEKECLFRNPDTGEIKFDYAFELMCCKNEYSRDNFLTGKVIGEFECDEISEIGNYEEVDHMLMPWVKDWETTKKLRENACMRDSDISEYLGEKKGYGWHISNLKIYDKPLALDNFDLDKAPTTWRYI